MVRRCQIAGWFAVVIRAADGAVLVEGTRPSARTAGSRARQRPNVCTTQVREVGRHVCRKGGEAGGGVKGPRTMAVWLGSAMQEHLAPRAKQRVGGDRRIAGRSSYGWIGDQRGGGAMARQREVAGDVLAGQCDLGRVAAF